MGSNDRIYINLSELLTKLLTAAQKNKLEQLRCDIEAVVKMNQQKHLKKIKDGWPQLAGIAALSLYIYDKYTEKVTQREIKDNLENLHKYLDNVVTLLQIKDGFNSNVLAYGSALLCGHDVVDFAMQLNNFRRRIAAFIEDASKIKYAIEQILEIFLKTLKGGAPRNSIDENISLLVQHVLKNLELPCGTQEGSISLMITAEIRKCCTGKKANASARAAQRATKLNKSHKS